MRSKFAISVNSDNTKCQFSLQILVIVKSQLRKVGFNRKNFWQNNFS
jgi:hypothetical protein